MAITNDLLYNRQAQLDLDIPTNVCVVGLGGIGAWVAILSAMSGVPNLYLFDPDKIEEHNRNRLPFCQGSLNQTKVDVVRNYILAIRPEATVVAIPEKLEGIMLTIQLSVSGYIVDCTDSPKAQFTIYNACKKMGVKYIRAGYDGTHITVAGVVSGWIKTGVEEEAYTVNPSWVVPAVTVAALAVGKMMKYPNQEVSLDISEIGIPVLQRNKKLTARCVEEVGGRPVTTRPASRYGRVTRGF
jgi:molybdopterin/thiamine biosynthesis adenylyltransferase